MDGSKTISGSYVSHDTREVTILQSNGKEITVNLSNLHEQDKIWLKGMKDGDPLPDESAIFDKLCFGDSRDEVIRKLKESKFVEGGLDETFIGRTGINGIFRTKEKIGGLQCELYFDWSPGDNLKELTLQSQSTPRTSYNSSIKENWEELAKILTMLHGTPIQAGHLPDPDQLQNDMFLGSHLWRLEGGGSALLGTSMQSGKCMVVVRFTTERIDPVRVP